MTQYEADFVMQNGRAIYPEVEHDGLEMYLDTKGKKNTDRHNNTLLDMSGNTRHGKLHNFAYDKLSGYTDDDGLVFDGIDDKLVVDLMDGLSEDAFTYQLNNNIIAFAGDTARWIKDGKVMERKGVNKLPNSIIDNALHWSIAGGVKYDVNNGAFTVTRLSDSGLEVSQNINHVVGHKYYISVEMLSDSEDVLIALSELPNPQDKHSGSGKWEKLEIIAQPDGEPPYDGGTISVRFLNSQREGDISDFPVKIREPQIIDLTATFGAGNEPTLEEIQVEPDKWQWLPNPMDLLEAKELKGNILGDMEDVVDAEVRDQQLGKDIYTDNADDSYVHVEVDGQSYQNAKQGSKNLAPHPEYWELTGGATYEDGAITIVDGSRAIAWIPWDGTTNSVKVGFDVLSGDKQLINFDYYDNNKVTKVLDVDGKGTNNGYAGEIKAGERATSFSYYTIDDSVKYVRVQIISSTLTDVPYTIKNISVRSDSHEYEPPAPTPDYPIEVHSLNDFDVVSSVGKRNLVINSDKPKKLDGRNEFGLISTNVYKMIERNEKHSTYTISIKMRGSGRETNIVQPYILGTYLMGNFNITDEYRVYTSTFNTRDAQYRDIYFYGAGIDSIEVEWIKIEKGSTATPYSPAPEDFTEDDNQPLIDKINLSLSEPLRSVGDVKDRLFRDSDGLWKIERRVAEDVFDGSESWVWHYSYSNSEKDAYETTSLSPGAFRRNPPLSNMFIGTEKNNAEIGRVSAGSRWVTFSVPKGFIEDTSDYSGSASVSSSKVKDFLRENNLVVVYERMSSDVVIEALPKELQDKLNNLRSFQDSNYVYTVINDKTDNLSPVVRDNLKPTLHTEFLAKDYLKENRTVNNLLIWDRPLNDDELLHQNRLFHRRFNFRSDTIKGESVVWNVNLLNGGVYAHSLEQNYTIEI